MCSDWPLLSCSLWMLCILPTILPYCMYMLLTSVNNYVTDTLHVCFTGGSSNVNTGIVKPAIDTPSSGHFMTYFVTAIVFVVIGYLLYHNKQKVSTRDIITIWHWGHYHNMTMGTLSQYDTGDIITKWHWGHYYKMTLGTLSQNDNGDIITKWHWGHYHKMTLGTLSQYDTRDIITKWHLGHYHNMTQQTSQYDTRNIITIWHCGHYHNMTLYIITIWHWGHYHNMTLGTLSQNDTGDIITKWHRGHYLLWRFSHWSFFSFFFK